MKRPALQKFCRRKIIYRKYRLQTFRVTRQTTVASPDRSPSESVFHPRSQLVPVRQSRELRQLSRVPSNFDHMARVDTVVPPPLSRGTLGFFGVTHNYCAGGAAHVCPACCRHRCLLHGSFESHINSKWTCHEVFPHQKTGLFRVRLLAARWVSGCCPNRQRGQALLVPQQQKKCHFYRWLVCSSRSIDSEHVPVRAPRLERQHGVDGADLHSGKFYRGLVASLKRCLLLFSCAGNRSSCTPLACNV